MIWFYEKQDDLLVCEVRKTQDDSAYEFEIAYSQGPDTRRFDSPSDLIAGYLTELSRLKAAGWHPRAGNIDSLE